ncbi:RIO1/ZK632.3/MJ0444 family protein [Janibacter sp. HTCC2649]|uniref:serine protein kinase RIO n=1 Tax=Janibacter sp. HTCC2649 TaxID=313589 RepID=UPI0000670D64|nr:RIO1 family regulatory kinase/ATPase [Janibacter sp. HTCC2649]EAQ00017.1 RIO1/ZK632.3/MJ0444 family protein [Janibacter sp. HTCC2649]
MSFHDSTTESPLFATDTSPDAPPEGERWSSWDGAMHGPTPRPDWVITALGAVEEDLGVLKTGKEADVHLIRRWLPDGSHHLALPGQSLDSLLAAKRYRGAENRLFHRDGGYLEGRRVRKSREMRAMARRTEFGRSMIAGQWAAAEFDALGRLWELGLPVPYPVQLNEAEMLMEFVGIGHTAAPRLVQTKPSPELLAELFEQFRQVVLTLAQEGWAHGDLSPYNVLVHDDRLVVIDWPQIVDVVGNPHGFEFLERDVRVMCDWFTRRGLTIDADLLFGDVAAMAAGSGW